jgi:hypothetical protein
MPLSLKKWEDEPDPLKVLEGKAAPTSNTPLNAAGLVDLEERLGAYADGKQPLDADLTAIAGITPDEGDMLIYNGGKWARLARGSTGEHIIVRSDGTLFYTRAPRITPEMFGAKGDSNGSAGNGTDDSTAIQESANKAAELHAVWYLSKFYRITKEIKVVTDMWMSDGAGAGKAGLVADNSTFSAFVVGPGAEGSGTLDSGFDRGWDIRGGNCAVTTKGAAKVTGNAAYKLNGLRNHTVGIRVTGAHDIAFDLENNCYGATFYKARVEFGAARVGINFRKGSAPGNGEDQTILDSWISGEVCALHITSGKNYRVIGGQLSASRQATEDEDLRGVIILGKDYLELEGAEDTEITLETSFEYFARCWCIRTFKQVNINAHSSFNAGTDTQKALGFYKASAHGSSYISLDGCSFGGSEFSKPAAEMVVRETSNAGSTWKEEGSWGSYVDGTGETKALWNNMARRAEIPRAVGWRDGNIFYMQGMEFRVNGGILEVSDLHKETWKPLISTAGAITSAGKLTAQGEIEIDGDLNHDGSKVGFFGTAPVAKPTALTAANAETIDTTYGEQEKKTIENLRTRVNQLEEKLKSLGLLS